MKLFTHFLSLLAFARSISCILNQTLPRSFGLILLPGFDLLDVAGPLESLFFLSLQYTMTLSLISPLSLNSTPPSNWPQTLTPNALNSSFGISVLPTHTYATAPPLDVLLIPGGAATRAPNLNSTFAFVRERYPSLQYLITICTGAGIAARARVLDGKNATTNKRAWKETTALGPETYWISHARWVVDGNTWTGSGVSAGIDTVLAWISGVFGDGVANGISNVMEYERVTNSSWDPFAELYGLTDVYPSVEVPGGGFSGV